MNTNKEHVAPAAEVVKPKKTSIPQLVRGMHDILPTDWQYWSFILEEVAKQTQAYGFQRIETPVVEKTALFTKAIGNTTDIVEKEMYSFVDQSEDHLTLRPEYTAGLVRAYIEHGMLSWPQPVKLCAIGPTFRHERPQAGRYRSFWQVDFEIFGDASSTADALLIMLVSALFEAIKLPITVQINSVGCPTCRPTYRNALQEYYKPKKSQLCEDCKKRLTKNPLRILDCKVETCRAFTQNAPQMVDSLCEVCRTHFVKTLEFLDEVELPYQLNPHLVRGLDYYTRTVFEVWGAGGAQTALAGGGRYDNLVSDFGGPVTPAIGFAMSVERIVNELKSLQVPVPTAAAPDVFLACLGDPAKKKSLRLFENLRRAGVRVAESFAKDGLKSQLEVANRLGVKFTLVLGQKEMVDETIIVRDMENGVQEVVDFKKVMVEIKKRLESQQSKVSQTE